MKKIVLVVFVCALTSASAWAQRGGPSNPSAPPGRQPHEGPAAALEFVNKTCGIFDREEFVCPFSHPVDFSETKNIIPMNEKLWTPAQIIADYKKNRIAGQVGAIVLLKTEFCYQHGALCSVTTAAFEKRASKYAGLYRIYGTWFYKDKLWEKNKYGQWDRDDSEDDTLSNWQQKVHDFYDFDQGPGTNIIFLDPRDNEQIYRTDAAELDLDILDFLDNNGKVPLLDAALLKGFTLLTTKKEKPSRVIWVPTPIGFSIPIVW